MVFYDVFGTFIVTWIVMTVCWIAFQRPPKRKHLTQAFHRDLMYQKIAQLEIDLYGQTFANADSSIEGGCTNVAGLDKTGHTSDGRCNVNISLGPVCRGHDSPMPAYPGDPNWYDEDSRPW